MKKSTPHNPPCSMTTKRLPSKSDRTVTYFETSSAFCLQELEHPICFEYLYSLAQVSSKTEEEPLISIAFELLVKFIHATLMHRCTRGYEIVRRLCAYTHDAVHENRLARKEKRPLKPYLPEGIHKLNIQRSERDKQKGFTVYIEFDGTYVDFEESMLMIKPLPPVRVTEDYLVPDEDNLFELGLPREFTKDISFDDLLNFHVDTDYEYLPEDQ